MNAVPSGKVIDDGLYLTQHAIPFCLLVIFQSVVLIAFANKPINLLFSIVSLSIFLLVLNNIRYGLYLLIASLFLDYSVNLGMYLRLFDITGLFLFISYLLRRLIGGGTLMNRTPLDKPILFFAIALGISLINSVDLHIGIITYLWHIQVLVLFYVLAGSIQTTEIKNLLVFFLLITVLHSVYNIILFISTNGTIRAMGLAGVPTDVLTLTALIICYPLYIYEKQMARKIFVSIIFIILLFGLMATKTRGAFISFALCFVFTSLISLRKARKTALRFAIGNIVVLSLCILISLVVISSLYPSFLKALSHQVYIVPGVQKIDTTQIRFFLWNVALKTFLQNPIFGIGLGQFYRILVISPELRLNIFSIFMRGLDPHNTVLYYLSQTGLVGLLGFFYLIFSCFGLLLRKFNESEGVEDIKISAALIGLLFLVIASSLYAGEWFYGVGGELLALFLAVAVVFKPISKP